MVRGVIVLSLLVLMIPFSTVPVAAEQEDPHNRRCDGVAVVPMVCAGADGGGNGECDNDHDAEVSCWYTYGWNVNASSPAQLPGGGRLEWSYEVTYCISGGGEEECTVVESGGGDRDCEWTLNEVETCWEYDTRGGELDFTLELGQCVTVTAETTVHAESWALDEENPLFEASVDDHGAHGGAECHLDDGR